MIVIDHSMTWIIWPLIIFGLMSIGRGRSWRWRARYAAPAPAFDPQPLLRELDAQRAEMEEMTARIAELENRADFTERLLSAPHDAVKSTASG